MRYAVVKLTDDQFKRKMRRGGMMVLTEQQVDDMVLVDPDELQAIGMFTAARELSEELTKDRKERERRDGDRS